MLHTVHYPVLSAGQVPCTLGRGTGVVRLLAVLSTARYSPPGATEGKGTEGHQVLQVPVHSTQAKVRAHTHNATCGASCIRIYVCILVTTHQSYHMTVPCRLYMEPIRLPRASPKTAKCEGVLYCAHSPHSTVPMHRIIPRGFNRGPTYSQGAVCAHGPRAQWQCPSHLVCVCVCAGLWATSHVAVCVYAAVCVGVVQQWVDDQTERRIGAIFTLCT